MLQQFTSVQFEVVNIVTERSMNGSSTISFKAIDGEIDHVMSIKVMNMGMTDKVGIRELMVAEYFKHVKMNKVEDVNSLKVGDIV